MDDTTRTLIGRISSGKCKPVAISGYVGPDEGDGRGLRIYPDMNADHYYVVDFKCPIEMVVIPDEPHARVTVIVESASQIETVTRRSVPAARLAGRAAHAFPADDGTGERARGVPDISTLLVALARAIRAGRIDASATLEGVPRAAADAWIRLLAAADTPHAERIAGEIVRVYAQPV